VLALALLALLNATAHARAREEEGSVRQATTRSANEVETDSCTMSRAAVTAFKGRAVDRVVQARWQSEGMGARVRRSIGGGYTLDPFLMLDEFKAGLPAAFPDHPHRGMITISFLLPWSEGSFSHEDSRGHRGRLDAGDLQVMHAGRGILHSEVPFDKRAAHGLQLWVNLPAKSKMMDPSYQELKWGDVPHAVEGGVDVAVISGSSLGASSPVRTATPIEYLFVRMQPGAVFEQPVRESWNAFAYVLEGGAAFAGREVGPHNTVTFKAEPGTSGVRVEARAEPCAFVLISGEPLGEPVAQQGPFVMNSREEIARTIQDYHENVNGFEGAAAWESENAKRLLEWDS